MKCGTQMAVAMVGGYALGRSRKTRLALILALMAAGGGKLPLGPEDLLRKTPLGDQLDKLAGDLRGQLVDAGMNVAKKAASSRIDSLSDRLSERADSLRGTTRRPGQPEEEQAEESEEEHPRRRREHHEPERWREDRRREEWARREAPRRVREPEYEEDEYDDYDRSRERYAEYDEDYERENDDRGEYDRNYEQPERRRRTAPRTTRRETQRGPRAEEERPSRSRSPR